MKLVDELLVDEIVLPILYKLQSSNNLHILLIINTCACAKDRINIVIINHAY